MKNWGGAVSTRREKEKRILVCEWLASFNFSTGRILCELLGVDYRGQGAFFKRMVNEGLLITTRQPYGKEFVYSLDESGVTFIKLHRPMINYSKAKRFPSWATFVHLLAMQRSIIQEKEGMVSFAPERELKHLRAVHLPDAIVDYKDVKVAFEIELTRKSIGRLYNIFFSHLRNISNGHYDKVYYFFIDELLKDEYVKRYDAEMWPLYSKNAKGRMVSEGKSYDSSNPKANHVFSFIFSPELI